MVWDDDELELRILELYIAQFDAAKNARGSAPLDKCALERNLAEVIHEITGAVSPEVDRLKERWFDQLVGVMPQHDRPLHGCTDSRLNKGPHRWHARAFATPMFGGLAGGRSRAAWQRAGELRRLIAARNVSSPQSVVTLNISQSQVAALNLGQIVGNIQAVVSGLQESGQGEVATALRQLAEAIAQEAALSNELRREAMELVSAMGEEFARPEAERRPGVLRAIGARLGQIGRAAGGVYAAYELVKVAAAGLGYGLP